MRRSSSTSRICGASSAGCAGRRCAVAASVHDHSFAGAARKIVSSTLSGSSRSIIARRKRRTVSALRRPDLLERAVDALGLQARELADQRLALRRRIEQALPAVVVAGLLHDVAFVEQLLQHAPERLLGDAQDVEQVGDLQPGIAVDEMHDPVMRPAEAEGLQLIVGVADEVAVGEEQQLDDVPAQIGLARRGRCATRRRLRRDSEKFMSAILTYLGFNVTKRSAATKF